MKAPHQRSTGSSYASASRYKAARASAPAAKSSFSTTSLAVLLTAAVILIGTYEWRFQQLGMGHNPSTIARNLVADRLDAEESRPVAEDALWGRHQLLLLEARRPAAASLRRQLRHAVNAVCDSAVVSFHHGTTAGAVAAAFAVAQMPAVVYVPADCDQRTNSECRHRVFVPTTDEPLNVTQVVDWLVDTAPVAVHLANDAEAEVEFVERLRGGFERARLKVAPKVRRWMPTTLAATWTAAAPNGTTLSHVVTGDGAFVIRPPSECNFFAQPGCVLAPDGFTMTPEIEAARAGTTQSRLDLIARQPPATRNYTATGWEKRRTPPGLLLVLQDYFRRHREKYTRETFEPPDTLQNHEQVASLLVDLPEVGQMRPSVFDAMHAEMEGWAGVPLRHTAVYGIRVYRRGCSLANHVDRAGTHIISAIVNIEQKVDKPWPVEMLDHSGVWQHVLLQPGEMALYEGASCAHGRPQPLEGDWFANIFVHMTPK